MTPSSLACRTCKSPTRFLRSRIQLASEGGRRRSAILLQRFNTQSTKHLAQLALDSDSTPTKRLLFSRECTYNSSCVFTRCFNIEPVCNRKSSTLVFIEHNKKLPIHISARFGNNLSQPLASNNRIEWSRTTINNTTT